MTRGFALALLILCGSCKKDSVPAAAPTPPPKPAVERGPKGERVIPMEVTEEGYVPSSVAVKKGEPLLLRLKRTTDKTCATEILIAGTEINVPLPLNEVVEVPWTPAETGKIKYGCAMGMMISGVLLVE